MGLSKHAKWVEAEIEKECAKYVSNPEDLESASSSIMDDLIQDAIIGVVYEIDIERKFNTMGYAYPVIMKEDIGDSGDLTSYELRPSVGDIFGHGVSEKGHECPCPCCNRNINSSRFAPHLAKCMGMGRNSSRIARSRIASNANKETGGTSSCAVSDDEDDADWTVMTEKKGKKKKEKSTVKKLKSSKQLPKNGTAADGSASSSSSSTNISYESMSKRDRRALLSQICGVISEHNKKVCTKSPKCALHTDDQKKALRDLYLPDTIDSCLENLQIDVDTCEDENELTKEGLTRSWEAENSNTSSPADSASTSSSSSKKRTNNKNKD